MIRFKMNSKAVERQLSQLGARAPQVALALVNRLTQIGAQRASLLAPVDSGELRASIQMRPATLVGGVVEGSWGATSAHAPYVEYGTGAPGAAGKVANGQPRDPKAAGFTYTLKSTVNRKGLDGVKRPVMIDGWVYYDPVRQRFIHTRGQAAQPFMYPALQHVSERTGQIAADVIKDALEGR